MADAQTYSPGSPRVLVAGASGFAGALAADLLWKHPGFELATITARSEVGRALEDVYARFRVPLLLEEIDLDKHLDVDAAVVAYPHAAAAPLVGKLRDRDVRVVDLSADFRLRDVATYEQWYAKHPRPDLLEEAVYGLTELYRNEIVSAGLVANPGCFPTAALLALAPLAANQLIADVIIDAKTGVSGAGLTAPAITTHYSIASDNVRPYEVSTHRHRPEIETQLSRLGTDLPVQFQPHLVPVDQGKLSSCYVTPTRSLSNAELIQMYSDQYEDEPFIELASQPPASRDVRETNYCRIYVAVDDHTGKVLVFSSIDNLWKGSASQAIQNLNLMFGLDERSGILDTPMSTSALLTH